MERTETLRKATRARNRRTATEPALAGPRSRAQKAIMSETETAPPKTTTPAAEGRGRGAGEGRGRSGHGRGDRAAAALWRRSGRTIAKSHVDDGENILDVFRSSEGV